MALYDRRTSLDKNEHFYTENVIRNLETGLVVSVISPKKRAERLTIKVILETKELICIRTQGARPESTISLQQVKDLRVGKKSSDFERAEEIHKVDGKLCLVLLYGNEFNLKTFSMEARDEKSFKIIFDGLVTVLQQIKDSVYIDHKDRWICKQFHNALKPGDYALYCYSTEKKDRVRVNLKVVKAWLARINCKIKSKDFKYFVKRLKLNDQLSFPEFCLLFYEFLQPKSLLDVQFEKYFPSNEYSEDERTIGFETIRSFFKEEQKIDSNPEEARKMMLKFVQDPVYLRSGLYITEKEFIDFLFSPQNEIFQSDELTDDMDQPLSSYWIASSHNTYLTGNQMSSESSVEPYARCLQMGCRCVELDCWNGSDGNPIIFHGKSLTSKVRLVDVLCIINENAFKTSKFPVILSIENHCSVPQQRLIAKMMLEIFGDKLLTEPIVTSNGLLPSPNQLQNKIILKDKKLRDGSYELVNIDVDCEGKDDAKVSGVLHMKDKASQMWLPYFGVLTDKVLIISPPEEEEDEEDDIYDFPYEDIYSGDDDDITIQTWYHGFLENHKEAEKIIKNIPTKKEGTFLVRDNNQNGYTLSFWNNDKCNHCRIQTEKGQYYLNETVKMDSITELIEHYRSEPLYLTPNKFIYLSSPVPVKPDFQNEIWFHDINREKADYTLQFAKEDGTFLIRPSSVENCYSLSMIHNRIIRHFPIEREGRLFALGSFRFLQMKKLIDFFTKRAVYKNLKLKIPASPDALDYNLCADTQIYEDIYSDATVEEKKIKVRALYDFIGDQTQLSFRRGAIITNVTEEDSPWWRGNHGDGENLLFPANYVEILDIENEVEKKTEELRLKLEGCLMVLMFWEQEQQKKEEMVQGRAKELSDLIIYCQSVRFQDDGLGAKIAEMSSFSENQIKQYFTKERVSIITRYNQRQISRVYPFGLKLLSANYDPIPMWSVGAQLIALNYQTPDRYQQINHALFLRNQRCGYVLKPQCMSSPKYSPYNMSSFSSVQPVSLYMSIIAGRNCYGGRTGATGNPFVGVEILGLPLDKQRVRTSVAKGTTLCPIWENQLFVFDVTFPDLAFLRFEILDESLEKSKTIYAQATYPLKGLREGYRCVPLHNMYSERNELSHLLVHIDLRNPVDNEEKNVFKMIEELRNHCASLSISEDMKRQFQDTEKQLLKYLDERQSRRRGEIYVPARRSS
ncbi:hypothetical protein LOTGIDRAFT_234838 [Lottia gigantea]|uniref:Phosphoinositide phospholipase C n=1 Tax=Lottia gigantea TaxID=225164 RepID=V3ZTU9_LOTGI|nr:hypothetical protein LOTGIDRAFT_234838 [Lottia gigantea]ESO87812.1 hypothetical protein LOTGIDRAFT_234838 [Lottia gigantea]